MENETWVSVNGYTGIYEISNFGRIKSLKRKGVGSERILRLTHDSNGYVYVVFSIKNKPKQIALHRLLYAHFVGELIDGMVIDHIDNNKLNNSISNLQQITQRVNASKDRVGGSSSFVGVSWCKRRLKWRATIFNGIKRKHIGYYEKEIVAAEMYRVELEKLHEHEKIELLKNLTLNK